jgi:hypothetical protein
MEACWVTKGCAQAVPRLALSRLRFDLELAFLGVGAWELAKQVWQNRRDLCHGPFSHQDPCSIDARLSSDYSIVTCLPLSASHIISMRNRQVQRFHDSNIRAHAATHNSCIQLASPTYQNADLIKDCALVVA